RFATADEQGGVWQEETSPGAPTAWQPPLRRARKALRCEGTSRSWLRDEPRVRSEEMVLHEILPVHTCAHRDNPSGLLFGWRSRAQVVPGGRDQGGRHIGTGRGRGAVESLYRARWLPLPGKVSPQCGRHERPADL